MFDTKCVQSSNSKELELKHFRFLTAKYSTLKEIQMSEIEANVTQAVANLANPPVVSPPLPWASQAA